MPPPACCCDCRSSTCCVTTSAPTSGAPASSSAALTAAPGLPDVSSISSCQSDGFSSLTLSLSATMASSRPANARSWGMGMSVSQMARVRSAKHWNGPRTIQRNAGASHDLKCIVLLA
jgi:hypothetical protein